MNPLESLLTRWARGYHRRLPPEEEWHLLLTGQDPVLTMGRRFFKLLPADPRCSLCNAPFSGPGGGLMRAIGRGPSSLNPRFCRTCIDTSPVGGTDVELTLLFADIRGSTQLAEGMNPVEYGHLINRFFQVTTQALIRTNALIDRLVGDEVIALYLPAFAGPDHARLAFDAGRALLDATGHGSPEGPWIPVGVGIHTGVAFVGRVGQAEVTDITVLGDTANITARLASMAQPGEILISDTAYLAAGIGGEAGLKCRELDLRGRHESLKAWSGIWMPTGS